MSVKCGMCGQTFNSKSQATCSRCKGTDPLGRAATRVARGSGVDQSTLGQRFTSPTYNATGGASNDEPNVM